MLVWVSVRRVTIDSRAPEPTRTAIDRWSSRSAFPPDISTIPVQLINTLHLIVPFEVTAFVTRSYSPARCFSVRISCTEQSSMIFTPEREKINRFAQTFFYSPFSMASLANVNASGTGSTMKSSCTHRPPYPHASIDDVRVRHLSLTQISDGSMIGIFSLNLSTFKISQLMPSALMMAYCRFKVCSRSDVCAIHKLLFSLKPSERRHPLGRVCARSDNRALPMSCPALCNFSYNCREYFTKCVSIREFCMCKTCPALCHVAPDANLASEEALREGMRRGLQSSYLAFSIKTMSLTPMSLR